MTESPCGSPQAISPLTVDLCAIFKSVTLDLLLSTYMTLYVYLLPWSFFKFSYHNSAVLGFIMLFPILEYQNPCAVTAVTRAVRTITAIQEFHTWYRTNVVYVDDCVTPYLYLWVTLFSLLHSCRSALPLAIFYYYIIALLLLHPQVFLPSYTQHQIWW